ncbi:MAG: YicC family protein [Rhodanobacter sp. 68-29]|uniref:YicC/YloC family endoribonuclease n=1 Tax=Rhodanobacter sp. PCA2 TaxID=2006117 RepID=UPI00086D1911|nr:YicC/YloC family endoribonuclease [Rhodanobacter sp. PCA2]MBA2079562.1 YicC family protein [Rhodanobacter sp. PCA2]MBN8923046.1 YicC family protein [Rhodanobacter sp.]ODU75335.1 MAG: YicC family protein [Rhodanobacter sp. SCN 69-32]OJY58559.1 MAG: YicC family protein [Rhodanobacter sp. 68-29]
MIRSMTAYASAETGGPAGTLSCELRTVNHRYLELSPRLPDELRSLESQLRERIAAKLSRGKVDVTVRSNDTRSESLQVNGALLSRLSDLNLDLQARFPGLQVQFTELLRFPGVLQQEAADPEARQATLFEVLDRALDALTATREREGAKLGQILRDRLDAIERIVAQVREWMPGIRAALRARLEARLADLKQPADPGRLEQELVLQITRSDVDEELDRLSTHIAETRRVLGLKEPVGRRLDFLMQEFNREANTLGSKSVDARSTNAAVELKVLIEQMREQVQNIE